MEILIEIHTDDKELPDDIMNVANSTAVDNKVEIPGNATLVMRESLVKKAFGFYETIELALSFGSGIVSGIVGNWLYEKIKGRATILKIDRTEVQLNKGEIERVLVEKIEQVK